MKITILTESDIRKCVKMDQEAVAVVEDGFTRLAQGGVDMPAVMRIEVPENNGECDIKTAYVPGFEGFAVKMSSGFFDNYKLGLPSLSGMMVLLSTETGVPLALLLDNGYLTNIRTGAAGAVAAKHLARKEVETVGVIGAGAQARFQIMALRIVRDFQRILVFSLEGMDEYVAEMKAKLGMDVTPADNVESVVRNSDVVVTTTPAKRPHTNGDWLPQGLHLTAMGSDAESKQELHVNALARATRLVCDRKSQSFRLGEFHHGLEAGVLSQESEVSELGEITSGQKPGRQHEDEITICDLTGTGVQDTVIATLAYRKATAQGLGLNVEA